MHLTETPFTHQWWGLRRYHLRAPSPVMVPSDAFCSSENWQSRIKLACLSSLSRTCFWSMFSVSENRYISVFGAAAWSNCAGKWHSTVLISVTQRKEKQTIKKNLESKWAAQEWQWCYSNSQVCGSLQSLPLSPRSLLRCPKVDQAWSFTLHVESRWNHFPNSADGALIVFTLGQGWTSICWADIFSEWHNVRTTVNCLPIIDHFLLVT